MNRTDTNTLEAKIEELKKAAEAEEARRLTNVASVAIRDATVRGLAQQAAELGRLVGGVRLLG